MRSALLANILNFNYYLLRELNFIKLSLKKSTKKIVYKDTCRIGKFVEKFADSVGLNSANILKKNFFYKIRIYSQIWLRFQEYVGYQENSGTSMYCTITLCNLSFSKLFC